MQKYKQNGFLIFKIIGNTNNLSREYIINTIQEKLDKKYKYDKVILIGTQCIEAGIDIDMNIGFKDISTLDSDEQFAGRIERNFNNTGLIYFFDIDSVDFVYKEDYRIEKTLQNKEWRNIFENKEFDVFYKQNYKWLINKEMDEYLAYKENLQRLQYKKIHDTMKLIDTESYSFLFIMKYNNMKRSRQILEEYNNIKNSKLKFSEKQSKLMHIKKELNKYIYTINTYKFKNDILLKKINSLYIVADGNKYFDNLTNDGELSEKSTLDLEKFIKNIMMV